MDICTGCKQTVDTTVCWCGDEEETHAQTDHPFIPMGCRCYMDPHERKRIVQDMLEGNLVHKVLKGVKKMTDNA